LSDSKISKRYAKALLSLGREDGRYAEYGQSLQEFCHFCSQNDEFFQVISNQIFTIEDRKQILSVILEKTSYPEVVKNFLKLLLEKNRVGVLKDITEHYSKLTDELSNITRAEVITARPLKKDALERLVQALKSLTSKEIKINVMEDASIMGGLIIKTGDLVLDGSVRTQLEGLRESLKRGEYN